MGGCGRAYVSGVGWIGEMGRGGEGGVLVEVVGVREGWLGVEGRAVVSNARPSGPPPPPPPTADRPPRLLLFSLPLSDCTSTNGQLGQHCTVIRFFVYFPLIFVLNVCLFVYTAAQEAWGESSRSAQPISELLLANKHPL